MTSLGPDACPLCGMEAVFETAAGMPAPLIAVTCLRCGVYRIEAGDAVRLVEDRASAGTATSSFPIDQLHLVSGYTREMTILGHGGLQLSSDSARAMVAAAPKSIPARTDRLLLNLAGMSSFAGHRLELAFEIDYVLSFSRSGGETAFMIDHLITDGLVDREPGVYSVMAVSVRGWGRVEALRGPGQVHRQGFVAMSFEPELLDLYETAIAPAIRAAGYEPFIILEHEHAGQIDDQILLELNRSRFVVAEFTGHRPNVYFEAGYALGRGLPVIWTCREEDIDEAHFDTRQYNHLLWSTPADLRERLYRRIQVVVG
jgi:nucleoside 2-deoxyribosyltransferase